MENSDSKEILYKKITILISFSLVLVLLVLGLTLYMDNTWIKMYENRQEIIVNSKDLSDTDKERELTEQYNLFESKLKILSLRK